jgi:putative ABC transport system substrate-binding protein
MRRRGFIELLGGAALAWPLAARAQQPPVPVIGYLSSGTAAGFAPLLAAFRDGLNETGYVEGGNVTIELRWSEGQDQRLPAFVADLIRRRVAMIVATGGNAPAVAAKAATTTIPIVFTGGQDPVKLGLVQSLNRPGGNATGVLNIARELNAKRLELLRELVPAADIIAVLINRTGMGSGEQLAQLEAAAASLGQKIEVFDVGAEGEFDSSIATMVRRGAGALYVTSDPYLHQPHFTLGRACNATCDTHELFISQLRSGRWPDDLWSKSRGAASPGGGLRRPHPQGRQASGPSGIATDQVRPRHKSQDRQYSRPQSTGEVAGACRRGN